MHLLNSFKHAGRGLWYALSTQPNMQVHLILTIIVLGLSFYLRVSYLEFLIIIFTIGMVLIAEMVNTSIEAMTDLITIKYSKHAKIAKDVSAGMVLITAIIAVIVALIIFIPKF